MLDQILRRAIAAHASDIHLEPRPHGLGEARMRVDGVLRSLEPIPADLFPALSSRLKLIASMNIADRRQPQDGRCAIPFEQREIDARKLAPDLSKMRAIAGVTCEINHGPAGLDDEPAPKAAIPVIQPTRRKMLRGHVGYPCAGELGAPGKNISAPIAAVYLLARAAENKIEPVEPSQAVRRLMRNVLFFAQDAKLVRSVFDSVCAFVAAVPIFQLSFFPDQKVWELIG